MTKPNTAPAGAPPPKRGRGRPRKPDALTPAQRTAAYRARRKSAEKFVTVTKIPPGAVDAYDALVEASDALREELARVHAALDGAQAELALARRARDVAPDVAPDAILERTWARSTQTGIRSAAPVPAVERLLAPVEAYDGHDKRLTVDVPFRVFGELERLQAHFRLSRREVIDRLFSHVDDEIVRAFGEDEAAIERYTGAGKAPARHGNW